MEGTQEFIRALRLLPPGLRCIASETGQQLVEKAEEIRLRMGREPTILIDGTEVVFAPKYIVTATDLQMVLEIATRASVHSYSDSIRMGFVTADGGCRVGLCGTAITEQGKVTGLRRMSSVCIRIPREKSGCAKAVFPQIMEGGFGSTLIISPPGVGKTTLLRELVRLISGEGIRIALVDERNELGGAFEGKPCFELGKCTDVLTAAPKPTGVLMLLRSMSPQIIAFDEITAPEDIEAAELAANCGVDILATAHGQGLEDLQCRPLYSRLLERKIFKYAVIIQNQKGKRTYKVEKLQ